MKGKGIFYFIIVVILIVLIVWSIQSNFFQKKADTGDQNIIDNGEDKVVAKVNGESIYQSEMDMIYQSMPAQTKLFLKQEDILNSTINEKLILQEAKKEGTVVNDDEVNEAVLNLARGYGITEEEFFDGLKEQNVTKDYVLNFYRTRLLIAKFLNQTLFADIDVSEEEIEDYYKDNKESFEVSEAVEVSHILVNTSYEAELILEELKVGANFSKIAIKRSTGPSSVNGGSLGLAGRGQFVKEFEDAAFNLSIGEISEVVETEFGFHIITVTDKQEAGTTTLKEAEEQIRSILLQEKQGTAVGEYMETLRSNSDIEFFD